MKGKKNYKCVHCRRIFVEKIPHTCHGKLRIDNLIFVDRQGYTWQKNWIKIVTKHKWKLKETKCQK